METNFNFKSQVCTDKVQSERLVALGLKKETADMCITDNVECAFPCPEDDRFIPAWSLHRLIKLAYGNWDEAIVPIYLGNSYDTLIGRIEFQIKQGKINKDYLV